MRAISYFYFLTIMLVLTANIFAVTPDKEKCPLGKFKTEDNRCQSNANADSPEQILSTGPLAFPLRQLPNGHPLNPSKELAVTLLTDETMHRSRGDGVVMLKDRWLFFWREASVHTATDPNSVIKMGELRRGEHKLQYIRTIYKELDGVTATDIRARIMGKGRIGIFGSRRKPSSEAGEGKGDVLQPFFMYSDNEGKSWTANLASFSNFNPSSPSFSFNRFPASVGGDDKLGFVLYCHGGNSIYALFTKDNGNTWNEKEVIRNKVTSEVTVVQIGKESKWLMFGRKESAPNSIYKSTDMMNWGKPFVTDKFIGKNSSTAVYNDGYLTWIARSAPYHFENNDSRAIKVDGKVFEGMVTATAEASKIWENPSVWPKWQILTYLPVHFDGTFTEYNGNWFLLFGAIEGPFTAISPNTKYFSRLGIMTSEVGFKKNQDFLPKQIKDAALDINILRSDAHKNLNAPLPSSDRNRNTGVYLPSSVDAFYSSNSSLLSIITEADKSSALLANNSTENYESIVTYFQGQTLPVGYTLKITFNFSVSENKGPVLRVGCFDSKSETKKSSNDVSSKDSGSSTNTEAWEKFVGNYLTLRPWNGAISAYHRDAGKNSYFFNNTTEESNITLKAMSNSTPEEFPVLKKGDKYKMTIEFLNTGAGISQQLKVVGLTDPKNKTSATFFEKDFLTKRVNTRFDTFALGIPSNQKMKIKNLTIETITPKADFDIPEIKSGHDLEEVSL